MDLNNMNLNYKESAPSPFLHADYGGDGGSQRGDNISPLTTPPLGRKRVTNSSHHSMHKSLRGGRTGGDGYVPFLGMAQRELVGSISTGMSLPTTSTTTTGTVPTTGDTRDNPWQTNGGSGGEGYEWKPSNDNDDSLRPRSSPGQVQSIQSSPSSEGGGTNPGVIMSIMFSIFFVFVTLFLIVACAKTMTGQSSSRRRRNGGHDAGGWFGAPVGGDGGGWFGGSGGGCDGGGGDGGGGGCGGGD
mmetsp:Transcript_14647/g.23872  ORF Transcript_14647/g.23872 Transcript_14647/m.23872 type:complete len:244 (+) Transcript_14647:139-870(+)